MTAVTAEKAVYEAIRPLLKSSVWPDVRPAGQDAVPYAIYSMPNITPLTTVNGWTGENQVRMEVSVYHETPEQAYALAMSLIPVIEALTTVTASAQDGITSGYETEVKLFRTTIEFLIWEKLL